MSRISPSRVALALAPFVSWVAVVHCDASDGFSGADGGYDSATVVTLGDAGTTYGGDASADHAPLFRVAHLSREVGAIDICYRIAPTDAFTGPLLGAASPPVAGDASADAKTSDASDAAGPRALEFTNVTDYLSAPIATSIEVAVVTLADKTCSTPRARRRIALEPGKRTTFALLGVPNADAGPSELGLVPFPDDPTPQPSAARVRFIHAALGSSQSTGDPVSLAVGVQRPTGTLPLTREVEPRHASTPSSVAPIIDLLGYHAAAPIDAARLSITPVTDAMYLSAWSSPDVELSMSAGSVHTGFIVLDAERTYAIVWCDDLASRCAPLR
jgi:hypothetical protein